MKKVTTIYRFPKLVFDRGDNNHECFNQVTHNYRLWQQIPVRYCTREKHPDRECPLPSRLSCLHIPYSTPYSFLSIAFCSYFLTFLLFSRTKFCVPLIYHNLLLISAQQHGIISFCAVVFLFVMFKDVTVNLSGYPFKRIDLITQPPPSTHPPLFVLFVILFLWLVLLLYGI